MNSNISLQNSSSSLPSVTGSSTDSNVNVLLSPTIVKYDNEKKIQILKLKQQQLELELKLAQLEQTNAENIQEEVKIPEATRKSPELNFSGNRKYSLGDYSDNEDSIPKTNQQDENQGRETPNMARDSSWHKTPTIISDQPLYKGLIETVREKAKKTIAEVKELQAQEAEQRRLKALADKEAKEQALLEFTSIDVDADANNDIDTNGDGENNIVVESKKDHENIETQTEFDISKILTPAEQFALRMDFSKNGIMTQDMTDTPSSSSTYQTNDKYPLDPMINNSEEIHNVYERILNNRKSLHTPTQIQNHTNDQISNLDINKFHIVAKLIMEPKLLDTDSYILYAAYMDICKRKYDEEYIDYKKYFTNNYNIFNNQLKLFQYEQVPIIAFDSNLLKEQVALIRIIDTYIDYKVLCEATITELVAKYYKYDSILKPRLVYEQQEVLIKYIESFITFTETILDNISDENFVKNYIDKYNVYIDPQISMNLVVSNEPATYTHIYDFEEATKQKIKTKNIMIKLEQALHNISYNNNIDITDHNCDCAKLGKLRKLPKGVHSKTVKLYENIYNIMCAHNKLVDANSALIPNAKLELTGLLAKCRNMFEPTFVSDAIQKMMQLKFEANKNIRQFDSGLMATPTSADYKSINEEKSIALLKISRNISSPKAISLDQFNSTPANTDPEIKNLMEAFLAPNNQTKLTSKFTNDQIRYFLNKKSYREDFIKALNDSGVDIERIFNKMKDEVVNSFGLQSVLMPEVLGKMAAYAWLYPNDEYINMSYLLNEDKPITMPYIISADEIPLPRSICHRGINCDHIKILTDPQYGSLLNEISKLLASIEQAVNDDQIKATRSILHELFKKGLFNQEYYQLSRAIDEKNPKAIKDAIRNYKYKLANPCNDKYHMKFNNFSEMEPLIINVHDENVLVLPCLIPNCIYRGSQKNMINKHVLPYGTYSSNNLNTKYYESGSIGTIKSAIMTKYGVQIDRIVIDHVVPSPNLETCKSEEFCRACISTGCHREHSKEVILMTHIIRMYMDRGCKGDHAKWSTALAYGYLTWFNSKTKKNNPTNIDNKDGSKHRNTYQDKRNGHGNDKKGIKKPIAKKPPQNNNASVYSQQEYNASAYSQQEYNGDNPNANANNN